VEKEPLHPVPRAAPPAHAHVHLGIVQTVAVSLVSFTKPIQEPTVP